MRPLEFFFMKWSPSARVTTNCPVEIIRGRMGQSKGIRKEKEERGDKRRDKVPLMRFVLSPVILPPAEITRVASSSFVGRCIVVTKYCALVLLFVK